MGIFINMDISKSVTKQEWEKVYKDTLQLVKAFPLAARAHIRCRGINTTCLVRTKEHQETYGRNQEKIWIGWSTVGDYETMSTAEEYSLPRDLSEETEIETNDSDAMLGAIPFYLNYKYSWKDPLCSHTHKLWGNKTQGKPYHTYLLAIACTIEARLGHKAFVYGDITRGQCLAATELANRYLTTPIQPPDRCDMKRLQERISKLPFYEGEQIALFESSYMGTKDMQFGTYIQNAYSEKAYDDYWKERLKRSPIGSLSFGKTIAEYLSWGFDLEKLCGMVNCNDWNGNPQYETFINSILNTKLHWKNKDSTHAWAIDPEDVRPYGIYALLAQFAFAEIQSQNTDRFLPLEEIRKALRNNLGKKCDIDQIVDKYLEKEAEEEKSSEDIHKDQEAINNQTEEGPPEKYDICLFEELTYYTAGDTMPLYMMKNIGKSYFYYNRVINEEFFNILMEASPTRRCKWLVKENRNILIRDKDWDKIFKDIKEHDKAFERYYPMVRLRFDNDNAFYMAKAIVTNDDFYAYCKELMRLFPDEEDEREI